MNLRLPLDPFDPFRDELDALIERRAAEAMKDVRATAHKARRKIGCSIGQTARYMKERMKNE